MSLNNIGSDTSSLVALQAWHDGHDGRSWTAVAIDNCHATQTTARLVVSLDMNHELALSAGAV
jgi:hypothetical protein